jgi:hypothetical protein
MTHAWLYLQEFSDGDIQKLYTNGLAAYEHATDMNDNQLNNPRDAFLEAAAYYVEERTTRWCKALCRLAWARRDPKEVLESKLRDIEKE